MKNEVFVWTACAVIAAATHGAAWFELTRRSASSASDAGSPVVTLDLAPVAAAPPEPSELPQEARSDPPSPDLAPVKPADPDPPPPPPPEPTPVVEAPPPPAPTPIVETPPSQNPAVRAPPGREEEQISSAAIQSWQRELIAQIERHKRFPAKAKGLFGVVNVAFRIDRAGRLTEARILSSSGSAELDEAAVDLIRRSQPFPAPPAALGESDLSFVAPIRYLKPSKP